MQKKEKVKLYQVTEILNLIIRRGGKQNININVN